MTKQTNLIIGCGYLGRRVADAWLRQGKRVLATTRNAERAVEFRCQGIEPIQCDVLNLASLKGLPAVATVLYAVGFDRQSGATMRDVYVGGLRNVLDHLPPPGRFIHISSTSVYGQTDGAWVDESSATSPLEDAGRIVLDAERRLRERLPAAVILRFAGIYGPGRLPRRQSLAAGEPVVGDGERWLNLIHVDDGVAAVRAAEDRAPPGSTYNVCDDLPIPRCAFYAELARLLGAPPPRFVPPPPGSPVPAHESSHRRIANRHMRDELGVAVRYPTFREGLPDALSH
jgi:nucleoside-diphosphate-sugar epimerase